MTVILTSGQVEMTDNTRIAGALNTELNNLTETSASDVSLDDAAKTDSKPIKQHGGKRLGAGKKLNPTKLLKGVSRETLAQAAAGIDIAAVVAGLLRSKKEVIRLQALSFYLIACSASQSRTS